MSDTSLSYSDQEIERLLAEFDAGNEHALDHLLLFSYQRLRSLCAVIFHDFARVRRWEESDDVMQAAMVRLFQAVREKTPSSAKHYMNLAGRIIRRTLIDVCRKVYGPHGVAARHQSASEPLETPGRDRPELLLLQERVTEQVEQLPEESLTMLDLVFYQQLKIPQAAAVLGICPQEARRRMRRARAELARLLSPLKEELGDG